MARKRPLESTTNSDRLLTVREAALLDGCSERTIRRAIKAGLLKLVRVGPGGRLIRIRPSDHEAYRTLISEATRVQS